MSVQSCANCTFWERPGDGNLWGKCRKAHPQLVVKYNEKSDGEAVLSLWPKTIGRDWCGEYREVFSQRLG